MVTNSSMKKNGKSNGIRSGYVIGGTTMLGIGVGFVLLPFSALYFVASILIGIGAGLVLAPLISRKL